MPFHTVYLDYIGSEDRDKGSCSSDDHRRILGSLVSFTSSRFGTDPKQVPKNHYLTEHRINISYRGKAIVEHRYLNHSTKNSWSTKNMSLFPDFPEEIRIKSRIFCFTKLVHWMDLNSNKENIELYYTSNMDAIIINLHVGSKGDTYNELVDMFFEYVKELERFLTQRLWLITSGISRTTNNVKRAIHNGLMILTAPLKRILTIIALHADHLGILGMSVHAIHTYDSHYTLVYPNDLVLL